MESMTKNKVVFALKCGALIFPFVVLLLVYLYTDPFMVLRHYKIYDKSYMYPNEHYVEWQTYMSNRDSLHFDSFIMGNSCTMGIQCAAWEKYLDKGDRAFRMFGNGETLSAVYAKLQALERHHADIRHVMLVLDRNLLSDGMDGNGVYRLLPPGITGQNRFAFQVVFLQSFFTPKYLFPYCEYGLTHHFRKSMRAVINPYGEIRNPVNCDAWNPRERAIRREGMRYWLDHPQDFPPRLNIGQEEKQVVYLKQRVILQSIVHLCARHHADVKVIVSPQYQETMLNRNDLRALQQIFGAQNVYDFSGKNIYSADIHNFYDKVHFRPELGSKLLAHIYEFRKAAR
jgi:hypothetical protein